MLAVGDETLLDLPYTERRERLEADRRRKGSAVQLTPMTDDRDGAGTWLTGNSEGVIAKQADAPYCPGERTGMLKIKRVRTADVVVQAFRYGKEPGTVGSLILGLYDDDDELHVVGHTSGFTAKQKRELIDTSSPTAPTSAAPASRAAGSPTRSWSGRACARSWSCEIAFDHITGDRIRHGAKFQRWRDDKDPQECRMEQLRS